MDWSYEYMFVIALLILVDEIDYTHCLPPIINKYLGVMNTLFVRVQITNQAILLTSKEQADVQAHFPLLPLRRILSAHLATIYDCVLLCLFAMERKSNW